MHQFSVQNATTVREELAAYENTTVDLSRRMQNSKIAYRSQRTCNYYDKCSEALCVAYGC